MSSIINKDRLSQSIINQLSIKNQVIISNINSIIKNSRIDDYDNIKLLSKSIKEYLLSCDIKTQHSKILNIISKALGFQNHHSLKANLYDSKQKSINIDIDNDSSLKKLFLIKNEFLNKFKIEQSYIGNFIHNGIEFDFIYHKIGMGLRSKEKLEVNKYLKSYGFKPYKNTISLCKIKHKDIQRVAFNILQEYHNFFDPIWYEENMDSNKYSLLLDNWPILSYSNIQHINDLILVDFHSSHLHWNIVSDFLDYIFNYGTLKDVEFFEKCLKQKNYSKYGKRTEPVSEHLRVFKWEKEKVLSSFTKNKKDDIKETLENIKYTIHVQTYMFPYLKKIENEVDKSIKNIIIENCDYFFNSNIAFNPNNIKEKLYRDLLNKEKEDYYNAMEDIDDIELYRKHHDMSNCIDLLASEIETLIDRFKDTQKNYKNYYSQFRSKGYII